MVNDVEQNVLKRSSTMQVHSRLQHSVLSQPSTQVAVGSRIDPGVQAYAVPQKEIPVVVIDA